jgi:hypothetical protein
MPATIAESALHQPFYSEEGGMNADPNLKSRMILPMRPEAPFNPVVYADFRSRLKTGFILLCRPSSLEGRLITDVTHAKYSHATMIGFSGDYPHRVLMLGETREGNGARSISLSSEIRKFPGFYDVYRVKKADFQADVAWEFMCRAAGTKYNWRFISRTFLRRKVCRWIPAIPNSADPEFPRDCSGLVQACLRASNGPIFSRYDSDVAPGNLADPHYVEYVATLLYTQEQVDSLRLNAVEIPA